MINFDLKIEKKIKWSNTDSKIAFENAGHTLLKQTERITLNNGRAKLS